MCTAKLSRDAGAVVDSLSKLGLLCFDEAADKVMVLGTQMAPNSGSVDGLTTAKVMAWVAKRSKAGTLPATRAGLERSIAPLCTCRVPVQMHLVMDALVSTNKLRIAGGCVSLFRQFWRSGPPSSYDPAAERAYTVDLAVPAGLTGTVIGKGGATIKALAQSLNVSLKMVGKTTAVKTTAVGRGHHSRRPRGEARKQQHL
jgi:hypothetical protein